MPNTAKLLIMVNWFPNTKRKGKHLDLHLADYMYILIAFHAYNQLFNCSFNICHYSCTSDEG